MNSSGWVRGMMATSYEIEPFFTHVIKTIQLQLSVWDEQYVVQLAEDEGIHRYYVIVTKGEELYRVTVEKDKAEQLQKEWPYALDQFIWRRLQKQGVTIEKSSGNYLSYCAI